MKDAFPRPLRMVWRTVLPEYVSQIAFRSDGKILAAVPTLGTILFLSSTGQPLASFPGHRNGNGPLAWQPQSNGWASGGCDGVVRCFSGIEESNRLWESIGPRWVEALAWSPDLRYLAAAIGKTVSLFDAKGQTIGQLGPHQTSVTGLAWHPHHPAHLATVSGGGAQIWAVDRLRPIAQFDWGGASRDVLWSPEGRWVVTADQTASLHLYDVGRGYPLQIQGFPTRVKAMLFHESGARLAVGCGNCLSLWDCTGEHGPENTTPLELYGHTGEITCLAKPRRQEIYASGADDGWVFLWWPERMRFPVYGHRLSSAITSLSWQSDQPALAASTAEGEVVLLSLPS